MDLRATYLCFLKVARVTFLYALWVAPASASEKVHFDITATSMEDALVELGNQADLNVLFFGEQFKGLRSRALHGLYTQEDALMRLLSGSQLCFSFDEQRSSVTINRCAAHAATDLRRNTDSGSGPSRPQDRVELEVSQSSGDLETVTVTGSHIPWINTVGPHPIVLTQEDFARYGIRTLADLGGVLPQIFGGGPSQDTRLIGTETRTNSGLGSAINLRGLGARATLVLINGRRLAPSGTAGAFVDVSNIPLSAIQRVEILVDGVSAVYGADSVAGVVNIITRGSHDEEETSAHISAVTEGVWREGAVAQTIVDDWTSGGVFASAEWSKNTALPARDRAFGQSNLSSLGGPNLSLPESWPPTLTVGAKTWAVEKGVMGTPSVAQLLVNSENSDDAHSNSDLLPLQDGVRVYGQAHQSIDDRLRVTVEGMQTLRQGTQLNGGDRVNIPVFPTSPYYLPEIGNGAPIVVERDLFNVLGPETTHVDVQTSYGAVIVDASLGGDRTLELSASRALETEHQKTTGLANMTALEDPAVGFDPFAERSSLSSATLAAIQDSDSLGVASELHEYGAQVTGSIARSLGGAVTGALGVEYRTQMLRTCDSTVSGEGCDRYGRRLKAGFVELMLPLFGGERSYTGLQVLEISVADRYEDYSDFGPANTPRFGLRWLPVSGLELKGSWARSIRVPDLPDLNTSRNAIVTGPVPSGPANAIYLLGNNSGLKAERARTGTLEVTYTQKATDDSTVSVGADFFDIHYFDRIQSVESIGPDLLTNQTYESVVSLNPSEGTVDRLCNDPQFFGSRAACLMGQYEAIVDLRLRNIDSLLTQGIDFQGSWTTRAPWGKVDFRLAGTYLLKYSDKATPTGPTESLLDTQNNPIDLQAHASVDMTYLDFGGRATVNFSNKYRDTVSIPNRAVGSWTTVDLQLRYEPYRRVDSAWNGVSVSLDVQNVLNRNPPFLINYAERRGYDEENADPLNRVIGVHLRKRW